MDVGLSSQCIAGHFVTFPDHESDKNKRQYRIQNELLGQNYGYRSEYHDPGAYGINYHAPADRLKIRMTIVVFYFMKQFGRINVSDETHDGDNEIERVDVQFGRNGQSSECFVEYDSPGQEKQSDIGQGGGLFYFAGRKSEKLEFRSIGHNTGDDMDKKMKSIRPHQQTARSYGDKQLETQNNQTHP